jgi:arginine:ornithine antiporter/lysine permease
MKQLKKPLKVTAAGKGSGGKELGIFSLTSLVIGSVIGSGVFNMMSNMAASAGLMGIILGWVVTAIGMTFLVLTFRNLNKKKPKLDAGIYSYAEAGFGRFMGFSSAWGYWISAWIGNVAYATLAFSSLSYFFKLFGDGQNVASVIGASVLLWAGHFLILRGVKSASFMNSLVTIAKLAPIAIFILAVFFAFKLDIFTKDIWGSADLGSLFNQVKGTMLVTVWSFIGIEGAVIFSGRAKHRSDVAKASFLGLYTVIAVYVLVTVLSLGVKSRPELAALSAPGMSGVLEAVVGTWGAVLVNIGVIVSVIGAWLAWTMFSFELPFRAAEKGTFPAFFAKTNKNGTPVVALTITNGLVQLFLFTFLVSASAYNLGYSLATSTILIPYVLTALYQLKVSLQEKVGTPGRTFNITIGAVATLYGAWLIYAAGLKYLLLTAIIYGVGVVVYVLMRVLSGKKPLKMAELAVAAVFVVGAIYAIQQLISGGIKL